VTATIGASSISMTFWALGSCTFLSIGNSPDAEKLISRKMTIQRRKSMNGISGRSMFTLRPPPPATLWRTNLSGM